VILHSLSIQCGKIILHHCVAASNNVIVCNLRTTGALGESGLKPCHLSHKPFWTGNKIHCQALIPEHYILSRRLIGFPLNENQAGCSPDLRGDWKVQPGVGLHVAGM
jgi:hypothetical protein